MPLDVGATDMCLTPEVAQFLLFVHHGGARSAPSGVDARNFSAEDVVASERRLARLRPRCFLRTVLSDWRPCGQDEMLTFISPEFDYKGIPLPIAHRVSTCIF